MKGARIYPLILMFLSFTGFVRAQLSGYSLSEFQMGNLPGMEPIDRTGLYNQLNLNYRQDDIRLFVRMENYYSSDSIDRNYLKATQYRFNYNFKNFNFTLGSINETLRKGLLYRGFEITSSIYEDFSYRTRYGFYRDLNGASLKYQSEKLKITAIRGTSLDNLLPPTLDDKDRRTTLVEAIEASTNFSGQTPGFIVMRSHFSNTVQDYISFFSGGLLPLNNTYYIEYAQKINDQALLDFSGTNSYGLYMSINGFASGIGYSLEYKNYNQMFIGNGISDPPTLVKEHSYRLLNRSTHLPYLTNERGYQGEVYIQLSDNDLLTLNHSHAKSDLGITFNFYEYFLEYSFSVGQKNTEVKVFADYAIDEILLESLRVTTGADIIFPLNYPWSIHLASQVQYKEREIINQDGLDLFSSITLAKSTNMSFGVEYEFTSDPPFANRIETPEIEKNRNFIGLNASYRPNRNNTLNMFIGERRGGPACSSGICYEVLSFKGIELRYRLNFR